MIDVLHQLSVHSSRFNFARPAHQKRHPHGFLEDPTLVKPAVFPLAQKTETGRAAQFSLRYTTFRFSSRVRIVKPSNRSALCWRL